MFNDDTTFMFIDDTMLIFNDDTTFMFNDNTTSTLISFFVITPQIGSNLKLPRIEGIFPSFVSVLQGGGDPGGVVRIHLRLPLLHHS